jgi:glycosidase
LEVYLLEGILEEVDHFVNLGIQTIWLSPVYKSPMADFGYDISDYRDVDPIFGTLDDLKQLFDALHDRGSALLKLIHYIIITFKFQHYSIKKSRTFLFVWLKVSKFSWTSFQITRATNMNGS